MFPTSDQFKKWSLPSKATYVSFVIGIIALFFTIISYFAPHQIIANTQETQQTKVSTFMPTTTQKRKNGHCWTQSFAARRPDAWRCSTDNGIYDPCFQIVTRIVSFNSHEYMIICNAFPNSEAESFALELSEPLPSSTDNPDHILGELTPESVWMLVLEDGSTCQFISGASAEVFGSRLNYICDTQEDTSLISWIVGRPNIGKIWTASRIILDEHNNIINTSIVKVIAAYR